MTEEALLHLDYKQIVVVPDRNKRFEMGDLEELAQSIKDNGVREPIKVEHVDGKYQLINGHRRHQSIGLILSDNPKFKIKIPALVTKLKKEEDIIAEMLIANDGKPFLPLEEACMLEKLRQAGLSVKAISVKVGKSVSHVSDRLSLVSADGSLQEAVKEGKLSTSDAITITRKTGGDQKQQKEIMDRVKSEGTTFIQTELKKGRLQKHQWDAAQEAFGDFQAALSGEIVIEERPLTFEQLKQFSVIQGMLDNPIFDLMFQYGRMCGIAELASLTTTELANRLEEKATGKTGTFK